MEDAKIAREPGKYGVLLVAMLSTSVSALLVRLADAPGIVTAMWRNVFAAAIVLPFALGRGMRDLAGLTRRQRLLLVVSGLALGLHLAAYIVSLDYTTVASTMFFVAITPIFVALGSQFVLHERVAWPVWIAIAITVCGGVIIVGVDIEELARLRGDAFALAAAFLVTVYLLIGRTLRPKLHIVSYVGATYTISAAITVVVAVALREPVTGYAADTWLMFILLALVPSVLGHGSYNWALRHFQSYVISVVNLGEPVIAIVLAALFLHEVPSATKALGGAILLAGIFMVIYYSRPRRLAPQPVD
jgi:drug/metabolite transporter (DMT)-like permease